MKTKIRILLLILSTIFTSCENVLEQSNLVKTTTTRGVVDEYSIEQLVGIPVYIEIAQQYGTGKYWSLWYDNQEDWYKKGSIVIKESNTSSYSKFIIRKDTSLEDPNYYTSYIIEVVGKYSESPFNNKTLYLRRHPLIIYGGDQYIIDEAYSYRHSFIKVPETEDQFLIINWIPSKTSDYNQIYNNSILTSSGSDINSPIDYEKGNLAKEHLQKWRITPADIFDIIDISYSIEPGDLVSHKPDFITNLIVKNETSLEQSMEVSFTEKAILSSSFSKNASFKLNISTTVSTPKFLGGGADITVSKETSNSVSFNENETKEDQRAYKFPVRVPPYTVINAQAAVQQYQADISYTAIFRGRSSGKTITLNGQWVGVTAGTITYTLREASTNKILKTFIKLPEKEIDLTKGE